jgi:hypothetical protein
MNPAKTKNSSFIREAVDSNRQARQILKEIGGIRFRYAFAASAGR